MNTMRKLLEAIDAAKADDSLLDKSEITPDDDQGTEIRILPEELRRHFTVMVAAKRSLAELQRKLQAQLFEMGREDPKILEAQADCQLQLDVEVSSCKQIEDNFWVAVRRTFPELLREPTIALRKGWQVVAVKKEDDGRDCAKCAYRDVCYRTAPYIGAGRRGRRGAMGPAGIEEILTAMLAGEV